MSEISVTFVLGAGSSAEVGMPVGDQLKLSIASSLDMQISSGLFSGGNPIIREAIQFCAEEDGNAFGSLITACRLVSRSMPQAISIDNFIHSHRENPYVATVGKLAIASCILSAEQQSALYCASDAVIAAAIKNTSATWYNLLFQQVTQYRTLSEVAAALSRIRVITFNYDRTLEHFLVIALMNYYGVTREKATEVASTLKIFHPYGTVGRFFNPGRISKGFGNELRPHELANAAKELRTFTEEAHMRNDEVEEMRDCIWNAENLVFLGYAFHELNNQILFGDSRSKQTRFNNHVFGTAYGFSETNKAVVKGEIRRLGMFDRDSITLRSDLLAADLLREYSRTLKF